MRSSFVLACLATSILTLSCTSGSSTGTGVGAGGGGGGGGGGANTGALDGTWDITSYNTFMLAPSQMTIKNGAISGTLVAPDEGTKPAGSDCMITKNRVDFTISITGSSLTGTATPDFEGTGTGCDSSGSAAKISATRNVTAGATDTDLNGDWTLTVDDNVYTVTVNGLTAQVWQGNAKTATPDDNVNASGGTATMTNTTQSVGVLFAAKKQ